MNYKLKNPHILDEEKTDFFFHVEDAECFIIYNSTGALHMLGTNR